MSGASTPLAYVLISYGPDGFGAYLTSGKRLPLPAAGAAEFPNTQSTAFSGSTSFVAGPYAAHLV